MRGVTVLDVQKLVSGLISTRTPHAGSDFFAVEGQTLLHVFQPALPMRGVTSYTSRQFVPVDFNPHSPCGE